ncbi:LacI family DNA-binding transcriptional regulator [Formosa sp. L2A11]|uniref:LacI family DNA-binding transcriptional regulator n=1 Tax=Formosa sp. L2A11 TaxID=2686363 RepID=UPI00131ECEE9|nr:LacI family DNA-binding transcriptional regulator [Formosa sp. L2A11]
MSDKATIYDIAKKLNISAATVSRALNDHPKTSAKTKKRVQEIALELGYEQNRLALALKSGRSNNIGVIVPRIDINFFGSIIRGIEDELYPKGYHIIICQTHDNEEKEIQNINALLNAQVDGIITSITKNTQDVSVFERILNKNTPLIFVDRKLDLKGASSVTLDDFKGAYLATQHLIEQGCTRIVHLTVLNYQAVDIYKKRLKGYKQALEDNNISFDEALVLETKNDLSGGKRAAQNIFKLKTRPDGIFSSSDFMLLGAIKELKANAVAIPQDIAVVGFSNEPFTKFMENPISSVDQCPLKMGKLAAKVFLDQINNPELLKVEKNVILAPKLKIRDSSTR